MRAPGLSSRPSLSLPLPLFSALLLLRLRLIPAFSAHSSSFDHAPPCSGPVIAPFDGLPGTLDAAMAARCFPGPYHVPMVTNASDGPAYWSAYRVHMAPEPGTKSGEAPVQMLGEEGAEKVGVALVGDSMARSIHPAFREVAREHNVSMLMMGWKGCGCRFLNKHPHPGNTPGCPALMENIRRFFETHSGLLVFLTCHYKSLIPTGTDPLVPRFLMEKEVEYMRLKGHRVVLVLQTPPFRFEIGDCIAKNGVGKCPHELEGHDPVPNWRAHVAEDAKELVDSVLDFSEFMEIRGAGGEVSLSQHGRKMYKSIVWNYTSFYVDTHHYSRPGAVFLAPALNEFFIEHVFGAHGLQRKANSRNSSNPTSLASGA